ncbi:uncharacterized protein LODBEIA_P48870 [Lodderomyces beijingensis]|uniref:ER membrane protein complex subunit 6 n=1 Tax=Lodderomyces beijingensis TaxID=1775926 RepID=A0ABP0ZR77_9ASCO
MSDRTRFYSPHSIETNRQKLQHVHDVTSLALGVVAGIMTLESLYGFLVYFVGISVTNVAFYLICGESNAGKFFRNPIQEIYVNNLLNNIPGFVMSWCLVYALVKSSS